MTRGRDSRIVSLCLEHISYCVSRDTTVSPPSDRLSTSIYTHLNPHSSISNGRSVQLPIDRPLVHPSGSIRARVHPTVTPRHAGSTFTRGSGTSRTTRCTLSDALLSAMTEGNTDRPTDGHPRRALAASWPCVPFVQSRSYLFTASSSSPSKKRRPRAMKQSTVVESQDAN